MVSAVKRLLEKINTKLKAHYSAEDLLRARFLFYAGTFVIVSNILQIIYYVITDYTPLYIIVIVSTLLISLYMYMVLRGLLKLVSHLMITSIYILLMLGVLFSGGINSFILPIVLLIVTFSFYFSSGILGSILVVTTILFFVMNVYTDINGYFTGYVVISHNAVRWLTFFAFIVSAGIFTTFILYSIRSEEKLLKETQKSALKYRMLFDKMQTGFNYQRIILDDDGEPVDAEYIEANDKFTKLAGYSKEELIGMRVSNLYKDMREDDVKGWLRICGEVALNCTEIRLERYLNYYKAWYSIYVYSFEKYYFAVILEDITERKTKEKLLQDSLKEKEVLIKEIHHRVKNNLQIISSLLTLESNTINDEEALVKFRESKERVITIALIHESLYKSENLAAINVKKYIINLTSNLYKSYNKSQDNIKLSINVEEDLVLDINMCVPLGLILNEAVTNSLKYAFPNGKGRLTIEFEELENRGKSFHLLIADNGIGMDKGMDIDNPKSLGLELIRILVSQLNGTINLERSGGTAYDIVFTKDKDLD